MLKALSPIPLVSGKGTVEVDNPHASYFVENDTPEFYIQLSAEQQFGIIRLTPHENIRIAEKVTIVPVIKEVVEEPEEVEVFRKQLDQNGLYKIWPQKPLEPGEYAVVEYTPGKTEHADLGFRLDTGGEVRARAAGREGGSEETVASISSGNTCGTACRAAWG